MRALGALVWRHSRCVLRKVRCLMHLDTHNQSKLGKAVTSEIYQWETMFKNYAGLGLLLMAMNIT
jgi:hypothetical protein